MSQPIGRTELKYTITKSDCFLLRQRFLAVMRPDSHVGENGTYLVRSVYFDNDENKIVQQKLDGLFSRDKYRVRLYNYSDDYLSLERKSKRNNQCFKESCRITYYEYAKMCTGDIGFLLEDERPLMRDLYTHMIRFRLRPHTIVDYTREPFVYPHGNVRITFDYDIRTAFHSVDILNPNLATAPVLEPGQVVMEIKYDQYLPDIIRDIAQIGNRRQNAISKYLLSRRFG